MSRHRTKFDPSNPAPFELSRSKVESFVRCEACFWLDRVKGVKFPGMPAFLINSLTDLLLKREMDQYRGKAPHPWIEAIGFGNLIPFEHQDLNAWTDSLHFATSSNKYNSVHEETNILFGGGIDDMFLDIHTGKCHLVDFKSTANITKNERPITLEGQWKQAYKRQMDMYYWIGKRKGLPISKDCYFFYVDGQNLGVNGMGVDPVTGIAQLTFETSFIHYEANDDWVDSTLKRIKQTLHLPHCPDHSESCEHGRFLRMVDDLQKK